ncbi:cyclase family protein [Hoeflea poritis]|uniref:Cyclase family protein n=1 Tax=Hoeflea poritis TaxID=2993659 RepID=A0ABT4VRW2_9HYPH|nr:cyclase family protein [Hoeflea poritis]MDA4847446.1 cyclase family protein [Hoeflea poritis]
MADKRVCFDFEIEFSNGGGIQGQGFRLDIAGDDITDEALSAEIIRNLGLLMVGEIRILDKKIIEEQHKGAGQINAGADTGTQKLIDLSHTIIDGMMTYKGLPAPLICDHLSFAGSREHYAEGTQFQIGKIEMVANTGTYLDTPYHRYSNGHDLEDLVLDRISGVPGLVVRVAGNDGSAIDWPIFAAADVRGKAVLVDTGWSRHWGTDHYFENHPFLTEAAAVYLRDNGATVVGIDSLNIDDTSGGTRPVHSTLLAGEIPIVEHLCNLDQVPVEGFEFFAVPPKIQGMGTFPVRAHVRLLDQST